MQNDNVAYCMLIYKCNFKCSLAEICHEKIYHMNKALALLILMLYEPLHENTYLNYAVCEQQRHRSACASAWCGLNYLTWSMTKPIKTPVCQAKTQISLGIHPVWSEFAVHMKKPWILSYLLSTQWKLWPDSARRMSFCQFCRAVDIWI